MKQHPKRQTGQQLRKNATRFWRDDAGNVLFIMAAMVAVLIAFVGCAIDGARLYLVQTRLQQACDAGVLAGRKTMTDASLTNTTLDATATAQANAFFANNFRTGWFGTTGVSFTPTKTAQAQVAGTASVSVPMTLMSMFGIGARTLNVTCQAQFDIADTDIVFVLDTTGSMACAPTEADSCGGGGTVSYTRPADGSGSGNTSVPGYPGSTGYHEIENSGSRISAVRTAVQNFYSTLAGAADPTTHLRYGFVTYSSTVNAGRALMDVLPTGLVGGNGSANINWNYQSRYQTGTSGSTPIWKYQPVSLNVQNFVNNNNTDDPTKTGTQVTQWTGCVEAPTTTAGTSTFNQNSLPNDLNPDSIPTSDINSQWRPMWQDVIYARNNYGNTATQSTTGDSGSAPPLMTNAQYGYVSCGKPVSRLKVMSASDVSNYVNAADFTPMGGTYHDTGMIWGVRLLSPNGIFAADTAAWSGRQTPNRVIVFLTDGNMAPNPDIYGMYGMEYYDSRISGVTGMTDVTALTNYHNARFLAECTAAKQRNINIFTVTIGSTANAQLSACATSPSQALTTQSGTGINNAFIAIAQQVAKLRLSK